MTMTANEDLLAGLSRADWPAIYVSGAQRQIEGEENWRRFLSGSVNAYDRSFIAAALPELEAKAAQHRRFLEREAAEDYERNRPQTAAEREESERMIREAAEHARYRRSTEGRLEAVEKLLVEIRDALQARR